MPTIKGGYFFILLYIVYVTGSLLSFRSLYYIVTPNNLTNTSVVPVELEI